MIINDIFVCHEERHVRSRGLLLIVFVNGFLEMNLSIFSLFHLSQETVMHIVKYAFFLKKTLCGNVLP